MSLSHTTPIQVAAAPKEPHNVAWPYPAASPAKASGGI